MRADLQDEERELTVCDPEGEAALYLRALADLQVFGKEGEEDFIRVSTEELKDFTRLTGNNNVHWLSIHDLCTTNSEISSYTEIEHVSGKRTYKRG